MQVTEIRVIPMLFSANIILTKEISILGTVTLIKIIFDYFTFLKCEIHEQSYIQYLVSDWYQYTNVYVYTCTYCTVKIGSIGFPRWDSQERHRSGEWPKNTLSKILKITDFTLDIPVPILGN